MKKTFKILSILTLLCLLANTIKAQNAEYITYASFNIRMDAKSDNENNWEYRKDSIINFIKAENLDIFGMQEVLPKPLKFLKKRLKKDYSYVGVGREDGKNKGEHTPIFYNKKRFSLIKHGDFWLAQNPNKAGMLGWDAACPRVVTWAKFHDNTTNNDIMVVNTHFDHVGIEARRNSAYLIMDSIKAIAGEIPVIMSGDFNVTDTSEAYQIMTSQKYVMNDSHKIAKEQIGNQNTFHNFGRIAPADQKKIDFIFVNNAFDVLSSYIPYETRKDDLNNNKQPFYLSDHNPVIVKLKIKEVKDNK